MDAYMVENRLKNSYVIIREAFVFFRVREDVLYALYCYLAELNIEVEAQGDGIVLFRTAVTLVLMFCLMTLDSAPRSQK